MTIRNVDADRMVRLGDVLEAVQGVIDFWHYDVMDAVSGDLFEIEGDILERLEEML